MKLMRRSAALGVAMALAASLVIPSIASAWIYFPSQGGDQPPVATQPPTLGDPGEPDGMRTIKLGPAQQAGRVILLRADALHGGFLVLPRPRAQWNYRMVLQHRRLVR